MGEGAPAEAEGKGYRRAVANGRNDKGGSGDKGGEGSTPKGVRLGSGRVTSNQVPPISGGRGNEC